MSSYTENKYRCKCEIEHETDEAIKIVVDDDEEYWIPISQVFEIHRHDGIVVMSKWIAKEKGLI